MLRAAAAVLVLLGARSAAAQDAPPPVACEVRGVASIERLRVRVPGERLRSLAVTDLPVVVRPGRGSRYRDVRVLGPVSFAARTDATIPWTVPRAAAVSEGLLWLTPEVEIEDVRAETDEVWAVLRAQVDAGVWVERVHVPCRSLSVGRATEASAPTPDWVSPGPRWVPSGNPTWLVSDPEDERAAAIRIDAPGGLPTPLVELERRGGHVLVAASFASGAAVRGWVRAHHLTRPPPTSTAARPFVRATPAVRLPRCRHAPGRRDEYVGPARVEGGAVVLTSPSAIAWAEVSEPATLTVSWRPGDAWARIIHVPGLRDDGRCPEVLRAAWVPRGAVRLQGEVRRPPPPGH